MKKCLFILSMCLLLFSCNNKKTIDVKKEVSILDNQKTDELLKKAINKGDTIAYKDVSKIYTLENAYDRFYFYAFMMATKHNYSKAYYDLYKILNREGIKINHIEMYSSEKQTQRLATYFLLKSSELGCYDAEFDVKQIFKNKTPNSEDYFCEFK